MNTVNVRLPTRDGRRNRPPTSCEPCRTRKYIRTIPGKRDSTDNMVRLKCNRSSPCGTCIKRNKQASCAYAGNANREKKTQKTTGARLQNLENLLRQVLSNETQGNFQHQTNNNISNFTDDLPRRRDDQGTIHFRDEQMKYVDSSHWLCILDEIKEVQHELSSSNTKQPEDEPFDDVGPQPEIDLMFGPVQSPTILEILQSLPPRSICDTLVSQFFNWKYMTLRKTPLSIDCRYA